MKKFLSIIPVFLIAILLTGCGATVADTALIDEVNKKMETVESGEMKVKMDVSVKAEGMQIDMPVVMEMTFIGEEKAYVNISMSFIGMKFEAESYSVKEGNKYFTYSKSSEDEEWIKEETTEPEQSNTDDFLTILDGATNFKQIKSSGNVKTYEATLPKDALTKILSSTSEAGLEFEVVGDAIITFSIDTNTKYLTSITMDLKDALKMEEEGVDMLGGFKMEIEFSKLNEVNNIVIPSEALLAE